MCLIEIWEYRYLRNKVSTFFLFSSPFTNFLEHQQIKQKLFLFNNSSAAINFPNWSTHMFPAYLKNPLEASHHISLLISSVFWGISRTFPGLFDCLMYNKSRNWALRVMTRNGDKNLRKIVVLLFSGPSICHWEFADDFYDFWSNNKSEEENLWCEGKSLNNS